MNSDGTRKCSRSLKKNTKSGTGTAVSLPSWVCIFYIIYKICLFILFVKPKMRRFSKKRQKMQRKIKCVNIKPKKCRIIFT